jgi:ribonuclease P protein component
MVSIKHHTLGKQDRLKSRKQIDGLFSQGKKITVFPFRLLYAINTNSTKLKAGFTVSSRNFPRAVDRNRIKRLSREAYRLQKTDLGELLEKKKQSLNLFFIYTGRELPDYSQVQKSIQLLIHKLVNLWHEDVSSNT